MELTYETYDIMDIRFFSWYEVILLYELTFLIMLHIKRNVGSA